MGDRLATILIFTMIGSACVIIAALPHISAYAALVAWATRQIG